MSIVERLRGLDTYGYQSQLACQAADTIEELIERLIQADLKIRSFPRADQSDVEFIREALAKVQS